MEEHGGMYHFFLLIMILYILKVQPDDAFFLKLHEDHFIRESKFNN